MADQIVEPHNKAEQPGSTPASPGVTDQTVHDGRSDPVVLDAVGHGTPEATSASVEHAEAGAHHEAFLGLDSYGWVAGAFLIFVALLLYLKVPKALAGALDGRSAKIRAELDEAKRLRTDAEALLADYKRRQQQAAADAEAILAGARSEAARIVENAGKDAEALLGRRTRMAEDKIAAAEASATADLRARAATLAAEAARKIIAQQTTEADQSRLTDASIAALGTR